MSFSLDVKTEICKIEIDEICCAKAELAGMICFGASVINNNIKVRSEHGIVAERFFQLIKHIYNINIDVVLTENGVFLADIKGNAVSSMLRDMRLDTVPIRISNKLIGKDCCKMAFVRGAFLGGGSVSNPSKSYHAEIATSHYALCEDFLNILEQFEITPKKINRNGNYVFYLKDSEQIENLLAVIGAHTNMMNFLNVKIEKEVRNTINRRVNCDTANFDKIVSAAIAQTLAIENLKTKGEFNILSPELMDVAKLRLENPEMPLSEMAKVLGISKSGVNHRMRKIVELAKE